MGRYLAQRLLGAIPTLVGVSVLTFLFIRLIPGDAIAARLGTSTALTPEQLASLRAYFGLDQPLLVQYWTWLTSLLHGDAGYSLPSFWLGTLIIVVFSLYLRWLPNTGGYVDFARDPLANLKLLLFPAITLGLGLAAATMRMTRSAMLDVLTADYVRTARAKGLRQGLVLRRHVLKNGLIVVVTLLGVQVGQLLGGAVVVEEIFSVPGVGRMLLAAIVQRDYAVVQGGVLAIAIMFVTVNIAVDLLYGYLDPRIRLA